ncbi:MAG TPA: bacillithiol system redox-active protein YtxJ [Desulfosporosinus sp.]|nr:bacillithiol system redox-active protein YtxJ [Desulfosporosinus sp.]
MAVFKEITSSQQLGDILDESGRHQVVLFKHSTTCSTSIRAWRQVQNFIKESSGEVLVGMINVVDSRRVSNQVADELGIEHQSPQVFLISQRKVLWHGSHNEVTQANLIKAMK